MGTTTTTTTTTPAPRFNLRDQQQQESIFRSRSQQGVPSQISVTTLNQLQQILARNNGEPQQNSFRTQQQIQSGQFNPQQNQQQFIPQQNQQQFIPQQNQQFFQQQQQGSNIGSSIQDQIRTQQEFLNKNRHRLSAQPAQQQQQQQQFFGNQQFSAQRQFQSQQQFQQ